MNVGIYFANVDCWSWNVESGLASHATIHGVYLHGSCTVCTPSRYPLSHLIIWVFITVVNSEEPCRYKNLKVIHIVQKDWDLVRYELTWSSKEDCVYDFYYDSSKSLILFIDVFLSVIFLMFPSFLRSLVYTIPYESFRYALNNSE